MYFVTRLSSGVEKSSGIENREWKRAFLSAFRDDFIHCTRSPFHSVVDRAPSKVFVQTNLFTKIQRGRNAREIRRRVVRETRHAATRESTCERTRKRAADPRPSRVKQTRTYTYRYIGVYPVCSRWLQSVSVTLREFPRFVECAWQKYAPLLS